MTTKTLEQIKQKLLVEKKNIEEELANMSNKQGIEVGGSEVEFPEYGHEDGDNAKEVTDWNNNVALEKNLEKTLKDVNKTLKLIEKGEYGVCQYCQKKIDEKRLLARPASSSCVRCKEKLTGTM